MGTHTSVSGEGNKARKVARLPLLIGLAVPLLESLSLRGTGNLSCTPSAVHVLFLTSSAACNSALCGPTAEVCIPLPAAEPYAICPVGSPCSKVIVWQAHLHSPDNVVDWEGGEQVHNEPSSKVALCNCLMVCHQVPSHFVLHTQHAAVTTHLSGSATYWRAVIELPRAISIPT
jgi:hypothetical protein